MKRTFVVWAVITAGLCFVLSTRAWSIQSQAMIKNRSDGSQTLLNHVPHDMASSKMLYHAGFSENLDLQIVLPVRNQNNLHTLLNNLYDPQSPAYHQWLTPAQFSQQFGYSGAESDYVQVKNFLQASGLSVVSPTANGLVIKVRGPVPAVERALNVHINHYMRKDGLSFFAPDSDPTIPAPLVGKILAIGGMDNLPKFKPKSRPASMSALAVPIGSGPGGFLAPNDIKTAYNLNAIPSIGLNQTIALFELDGYNLSDIVQYDTKFGVNFVGSLTNIPVDGFNGAPDFSVNGGGNEVTLDIELLTAFAQGSNILVYEASDTFQSWVDEWTRIATDNAAKIISASWGQPEMDSPTINFDNMIFQQLAAQGQAVFAAAGDLGAFDGGTALAVNEPASNPYVTGVGISALTTNANGSYNAETASVNGGGGISSLYAIPSYQAALAAQAPAAARLSTAMRNAPDVVLTGDSSTLYAFYINGQWVGRWGSSLSTPIWASFMVLVNQGLGVSGPLGFANPALYQIAQSQNYSNDFHDLTSGNNGFYPAEPGFDDATGLGSFNGLNLYNDLISLAKASSVPSVPAGLTATAVPGEVNLNWNAANGAVYYTVKRSLVSGGPYTTIASSIVTASYTDAAVTDGVTYYYVVSGVNSAGSSGNSSQAGVQANVPVPAPPALRGFYGDHQAQLAWDPVPAALSYKIGRSSTKGGPYTTIAGNVGDTSYFDYLVSNGSTYYYVVSAVNAKGTGKISNEISVVPNPIPQNLNAVAENKDVFLYWSASPGALLYHVQRSVFKNGPYTLIATPSSTNYTDTTVTNGTTYYYYVFAVNASGGFSQGSNGVSARPLPQAPTGLTTFVAQGPAPSVILTWSLVPGETVYYVKRSTTSGGPFTTVGTVVTKPSWAVGDLVDHFGLSYGTTYFYVVSGANNGVESPNSMQVAVTPIAIPAAPTGLKAFVAQGPAPSVSFSWNLAPGAVTYYLKRSDSMGGPYTTVATIKPKPSWPIGSVIDNFGLKYNSKYYYVLSGANAGGEGPNSAELPVVTPSLNATPDSCPGTGPNGLCTATVNWQLGSLGQVWVQMDNNSPQLFACGSSGSVQAPWIASGHQYVFSLYNASSCSPGGQFGSAVLTATVKGAVTISASPNPCLTATAGLCTSNISWNASGVYEIWVQMDSNSPQLFACGATGSQDAKWIQAGHHYVFSIYSATDCTANGKTGPALGSVTVTGLVPVSPPAPPAGLKAFVLGGTGPSVSLSWNLSPGALSYNVKRSTAIGGPYTTIATVTPKLSWPIGSVIDSSSVSGNTTYYYVVSAVNAKGEGINSAPITVVIP